MSNPIRFFENLRDMYLRYLDSPFDITAVPLEPYENGPGTPCAGIMGL